jgi:hypothetical protein
MVVTTCGECACADPVTDNDTGAPGPAPSTASARPADGAAALLAALPALLMLAFWPLIFLGWLISSSSSSAEAAEAEAAVGQAKRKERKCRLCHETGHYAPTCPRARFYLALIHGRPVRGRAPALPAI